MDTPLQHERRSRQRFEFQLPVSIRVNGSDREEPGFTQDLSARGTLLYTDCSVGVGSAVELTLMMPSEITLAESMRVRCRGKILRVAERDAVKNRIGLAVELLSYEYLPQQQDKTEIATDFDRISTLHGSSLTEEPADTSLRRS
ncbi:MAG TPA: PilZ domain-containing protein [Terriglobales bacterium]|nr:PilZ domain-containing protein [Terriglobales bacterium]